MEKVKGKGGSERVWSSHTGKRKQFRKRFPAIQKNSCPAIRSKGEVKMSKFTL
jgi:hypothetical protein